ncbi:High-affinity nickel-transporter [Geobacillus sp. 46C-IIa]|uniref:High-affinity nickel-transporter n=1 Tax=Geobacillus sp. 46C-IIa TaxID=1963025 RepID=UPI0009BEDFAF|nr:High-affinity nickel-transporter [Geobacillus sp. 46C-IIa]OQP07088.1 High-affinity nickel-transporter [Geobacillus sp. 46C-IIa]QNU29413.1 High-affinity nickel-transporter [Geobacillus sp. 46C-IIa]
MEWGSYAMLAIALGLRHGMDSDHVAAIADMVGSESERRQQLALGIMYAAGHGAIVFVMGLAALLIGVRLPGSSVAVIELLVGCTLVLLGGMMLFSLFWRGEVKSRFQLIYELGRAVAGWVRVGRETGSHHSLSRFGWAGAFMIGIIHGIGVESPTQLAILTHAAGKMHVSAAALQLGLFVAGLLVATIGTAIGLSWGFWKAKQRERLFHVLGAATGLYSIWLGMSIMIETWKGGV